MIFKAGDGSSSCCLTESPCLPRQHVRRNRQADLLAGFQIDHQLELRWSLDRQVGGLGAIQDLLGLSFLRVLLSSAAARS